MGEAIAFHNHSFTIFLNVGILFGPLLLQMSSKFIKTSKIRNSEEIPYGLQHVTALWITKCVKVDYKVWWDYKVSVQWSRFLSIRRGCNLSIHQMCTFTNSTTTAQKMKFSIKDFFRKCDQIRRNLGKTSFFVQFTATILLYWIWTPPQS